ncbi:MAG TPA: aspartate kinase [Anaerolineaceae bacterium]|jgi:aspartate kinase
MQAESKLLVMKFGGTSVGTVEAMAQAVQIIQQTRQDWPRLVVITSALSGVTDLLIQSALHAARGDKSVFNQTVSELNDRHHNLIDGLVGEADRKQRADQEISQLIEEFSNLCQAIFVLGEATPRALDAVAGLGERLSVRILAAAAQDRHIPSQVVESTQLIVTDDHYQNALPDPAATKLRARQVLEPLLASGCVPITTGFLAATPAGVTTTLGRGGSDYSAAILGVALQAAEVWIWTDVDGVMTADPRLVPDARTIPVISYREVAEMSHYGAKVLHPKSIHPVISQGIVLRVLNTFNLANSGTRVEADQDARDAKYANGLGTIKAVTAIRGLQLVTVAGAGMIGVPGVAGRIFSAVASTGISVPLIIQSTSEQTVCFAVAKESIPEVLRALELHLAQEFQRGDIDRVFASEDVGVITVICPGMRTTPGIAGKIFNRLGSADINILGTTFGTSEVSINLILSAEDIQVALRALHTLIPAGEGNRSPAAEA